MTRSQDAYLLKHITTKPSKPCNGVFRETGRSEYIARSREVFASGALEVEANGCVNLYYVFPHPVGDIEYFGIYQFPTPTGKIALAHLSGNWHFQPHTGINAGDCTCATCGDAIFK
jgi:hypothetical protein